MINSGVDGIDDDRGVTPVVGVVLLIGMVLVGVVVLFLVGTAVIDGIQSDSEGEVALSAAGETQHRFASIAAGSGPRDIPIDDFHVSDDGDLRIGWGNSEGANLEWDDIDEDCQASVSPLGAVEQDLDDRTIAYQSGAIWVKSDSTTRIDSSPQIGYDGASLDLQVLQTSEDDLSEGNVAMLDESPEAQQTATKIQEAAECPKPDLMLIIEETAYHEGWYNHLDTAFDHENATVTHEPENDRVTVVVKGVKETEPQFDIVSYDADTIVTNNEGFSVDAEVKNIGHTAGNDTLELKINPIDSRSIDELAPEESVNKTVSVGNADLRDVLDIDERAGNKHDLSRYGEYEYTLNTSDTTITSSFFYSYPGDAYYNLTDVSDETDGNMTTVTANMTNIGEEAGDYDVTISLEGQEEDISEEWVRSVEIDPWNETTVEAEFNRSALPNDEYTYTVQIDNPEIDAKSPEYESTFIQSGTFENTVGMDCDIGACTISDGADVDVSVIGTEISYEGYQGGNMIKQWGAVTASAVIGDSRYRFLPDGSTEEIPIDEPHFTDQSSDMEDYNLNTFGTQEEVYSASETIEEGTVSFESTYWECDEYEAAGTDYYNGEEYTHYDCVDFGDPITVNVEDGDEINSDDGFVMTRDAERNDLPNIEEGYERQRNINEVFQDGTGGEIEVVEGEEGDELTLGELDFAFMTEVTMDQSGLAHEYEPRDICYPFIGCVSQAGYDGEYSDAFDTDDQTLWNNAAWDIAQDYRHESRSNTGDPNFNDVIGLAQISGGTVESIDYDALNDLRVNGVQRSPDETRSESGTTTDESGVDIQVGSDHIVIG